MPRKFPFAHSLAAQSGFTAGLQSIPTGVGNSRNNSVCGKSSGSKGSHVVVAGDIGPVLGEDGAAIRIDLAECDGSQPGSFKPEREAADAAEEVEDIHDPCFRFDGRDGSGATAAPWLGTSLPDVVPQTAFV